MPRLAPLLTDRSGETVYRLAFQRDAEGRAVIRGEVAAALRLVCQRCLEPVDVPVDSRFTLGVVTGLEEERLLPEDYEGLTVTADTLVPRDIVEDELLLSVPAVPRHAGPCNPGLEKLDDETQTGSTKRDNPFAGLAALRKRQPS